VKTISIKKKRLEFKFHKCEYEEVRDLHDICKEMFLSSFVPDFPDADAEEEEGLPAVAEPSEESGTQDPDYDDGGNKEDTNERSKIENKKNSRTKLTKTLYKKIALHTHPDRLVSLQLDEDEIERRKKLYILATVAADCNDTGELVDIIVDLGLSPNIDLSEEVEILNSRIENYLNACKIIKESPEWVWYNASDEEKLSIEKQILYQMGLKKKE